MTQMEKECPGIIKGRRIEYWRISKNGIGFSDYEMNKKTRG